MCKFYKFYICAVVGVIYIYISHQPYIYIGFHSKITPYVLWRSTPSC